MESGYIRGDGHWGQPCYMLFARGLSVGLWPRIIAPTTVGNNLG